MRASVAVWIGVMLALVGHQAWAINYRFVDLHPAGYDVSCAQGVGGGQQVGWGYFWVTDNNIGQQVTHAWLWSGSAASAVDLNPAGFWSSKALGVSGGQQVGNGSFEVKDKNGVPTSVQHALLWSGSAASAVDLNPAGYDVSSAQGVGGGQQVGSGLFEVKDKNGETISILSHALLWSGSAASAVDLTPASFLEANGHAVSGGQQVGSGRLEVKDKNGETISILSHALLWSGSAASAVDLNPAGFESSQALGVSGGRQVGNGSFEVKDNNSSWQVTHALVWSGSAASAVDLNPAGFGGSSANGVSGGWQVGSGGGVATGGNTHALLWSGSAASAVDLHQFLPAAFVNSATVGIDAQGNIVGFAWPAWSPTPDPIEFRAFLLVPIGPVHWIEPFGGAWEVSGNWRDDNAWNRVPRSADDTIFDLFATYSVGVFSNPIVNSVNVTAGSVTWNLNGNTLSAAQASTVMGLATSLTVAGGKFQVDDSLSVIAGTITITNGARLEVGGVALAATGGKLQMLSAPGAVSCINANTLAIQPGGTLAGAGRIEGKYGRAALTNDGTIELSETRIWDSLNNGRDFLCTLVVLDQMAV